MNTHLDAPWAMSRLAAVALLAMAIQTQAKAQNSCPVTQAAVISTAGDTNGLGSLSQSFVIPPGYETISGRVRFLSNEWPEYFGTQFNDTFLARFSAPGKAVVLASGNVNSSSWSSGVLGYNGQTPETNYTLDVSGLAGKTASLHYEVRDVGDLIVDSALAIDAIRVIRTQQYVPAGGGALTGNGSVSGNFGQGVKLTFKNANVLGATIQVRDTSPFGETRGAIILPLQSVTFSFSRFGTEPMSWNFDVSTVSDAFVVTYTIESTWVNGMPVNPCF